MSLLADPIRALNAALKSVGGETLTYRRGVNSIDGIVGVPVRTRPDSYEIEDDTSLSAIERDWIIWVEDLAFSGERTLPQSGDEIDYIDALGVKRTYQVAIRDSEGGRCYRHTDQTMQQLRVFTVEAIASAE